MNIEYLASGGEQCPLIRIYGNSKPALQKLSVVVASLLSRRCKRVNLKKLDFFSCVNACELSFHVVGRSKGIVVKDNSIFECLLDIEDWIAVYERIDALTSATEPCYQWLDETSSIALLLSTYNDGRW